MCLAVYWARFEKVYYIATKDDAAAAGFDDSFIYEELNKQHEERSILLLRWNGAIQCAI
jgi:guanine deaminase